jgi:methionine-rich copper-binding protein CopC
MRIKASVSVVLAALMLALATSTAFGHAKVKSTSPNRGGTASTSIGSVKVTFNQQIRRGSLRVVGPGKRVVSRGSGSRDPQRGAAGRRPQRVAPARALHGALEDRRGRRPQSAGKLPVQAPRLSER